MQNLPADPGDLIRLSENIFQNNVLLSPTTPPEEVAQTALLLAIAKLLHATSIMSYNSRERVIEEGGNPDV